ncbi:MAG: hypothetical protein K8R77_14320 [Anaerolineaceae bacterium]|nr:hypothetical protein [Anaerolineaceae bacterium]
MSDLPLTILDTQIISYAFKGRWALPIKGKNISSITANEFLLIQSKNPAQVNYHVPLLSKIGVGPISQKLNRDHPFRKNITDQVILDFGNEYPTIVEYGNLAISMLINKPISNLFYETIKFHEKSQRRTIRKRYDFLTENEITCIPLTKNAVEIAMELLQEFSKQHNLKANFRNSMNDMLILASTIDSLATLITEDNLLNKFAARRYLGKYNKQTNVVTIDFDDVTVSSSRKNLESKGYINRGWRISLRN